LPTYSIARVLSVRAGLLRQMALFYGRVVDAKVHSSLIERAYLVLPKSIPVQALNDSLRDVIGFELQAAHWASVAWRLAGNLDKLYHGLSVPPWTRQLEEEWCPLQIEDASKCKRELDNAPGAEMVFRVLAGTPAGRIVHRFWSLRFMRRIKVMVGFSRFNNRPEKIRVGKRMVVRGLPFHDATEMVRLRLWGLFTSATCKPGTPNFLQVHGSNTFRQGWNRKILLARTHLEPPCPRSFTHPCFQCPVGYRECLAGCHPTTYVYRLCHGCGHEAWHVQADSKLCLACARAAIDKQVGG
jgi:hypothetical protein